MGSGRAPTGFRCVLDAEPNPDPDPSPNPNHTPPVLTLTPTPTPTPTSEGPLQFPPSFKRVPNTPVSDYGDIKTLASAYVTRKHEAPADGTPSSDPRPVSSRGRGWG